jgi:uncharacterized membrane protein
MWNLDLSQLKYFEGWRWALLVLLIAWALSAFSYRWAYGSRRSIKKLFLITLRAAFLGLGFLWALDPYSIEKVERTQPAEMVVLLDDTRSMALPISDDPNATTRWEAALEAVEKSLAVWEDPNLAISIRLLSDPQTVVEIESLKEIKEPTGARSLMQPALKLILEEPRTAPLVAVAIFSDGQWNDGSDIELEATVRMLGRAGVGLWPWTFGDTDPIADLRFVDGSVRQVNPFEPVGRIQVRVASSGFEGKKTWLVLREGNRILGEKSLILNGAEQEWEFEWRSASLGLHELSVELTPLEGEWTEENNKWVTSLDFQREKIRVIYMEGTPNETHQLENALESDPDIEVVSMYFPQIGVSDYSKNMPPRRDPQGRDIYNAAHPIQGFPQTLDELLGFDVVINSDIYKEIFSEEQLRATVSFVEDHGGGFVMVGGITSFGAGSYDRTVIDKLMPVDVSGVRDSRFMNFNLKFPSLALEHPIMKIGKDAQETEYAWTQRFPGFYGLNLVNRPKPGAVPLAFHDSLSNEFGPLVVFAVQQIGQGRTMAFTSDTTSGWGASFMRNFGDGSNPTRYYAQFWINAVRWLAADRIQKKSQPFNPIQTPFDPMVGEDTLLEFQGAGLPKASQLSIQLEAPDGSKRELPIVTGSDPQYFSANWTANQAGDYEWTVRWNRSRDKNRYLTRKVRVPNLPGEWRNPVANLEAMGSLANWTGVQVLGHNQSERSDLKLMNSLQPKSYEYLAQSQWDQWNWMLVWLTLIVGEWVLRKKWGFV